MRSTLSSEAGIRLGSELLSLGLTFGEALTIATALATAHDMVFLVNEYAREIAREFGLTPVSPMHVVIDALKKRLITTNEFVVLSSRLYVYEEGFR